MMLKLVRHARRRLFTNELLSQGINTSCAAVLAFILLLLTGTQVLDWYFVLPIPVLAAAIGIYLARHSVPSPYRTAQLLDRRLALADTLSTAVYFNEGRTDAASAEVRRWQFEQAARLAGTLDARRAVPYTLPRASYLLGALVLVASSLFALRYGLSRRLDLKPPLAIMLQQQLGFPPKTVLAQNTKRDFQPPQTPDDAEDAPPADRDQQGSPDAAGTDQTPPVGTSQMKNDKGGSNSSKQAESAQQAGDDQRDDNQTGDQSDAQNGQNRGGSNPGMRKSAGNSDGDTGRRESNNQDSGLLSKMKDAFQNLLSRMKPQQGDPGSQDKPAVNQNSRQPGQGRDNGGKQQAGNGPRDQQQESSGDQSGEAAQNQADSAGKGAGKSDAKEAGQQSGSGIGSQDGDKRIKQAEQLAAMGKISEIIGKRSANISGQATVEVQSTAQQLHTPYALRDAQHSQTGAEIARDEIPVAFQAYVERYFEQLRKLPPPKK